MLEKKTWINQYSVSPFLFFTDYSKQPFDFDTLFDTFLRILKIKDSKNAVNTTFLGVT